MSIAVVGVNHRTVPLAELEPLIVAPPDLPKALADLVERAHLDEVAVLSTCVRTEVYAVVNRYHGAMGDIREFLSTWSGEPPEAFSDHLYAYFDDAAVAHLFRVAAGLDSASVGEPEVLGQVRQAWEAARSEQAAGPVLGAAFNHAIQVGKRARAETGIARGSTSVAYAAVEMAAQAIGGLEGRRAVVIGLGEVGETAARALAGPLAAPGPSPGATRTPGAGRTPAVARTPPGATRTPGAGPHPGLVLVNRSPARAQELAAELGCEALEWAHLQRALSGADIVFCGTTGDGLLLHEDTVRQSLPGGARVVLVDLAVPRDIDPAAATVPGVTLLNMDDVGRYVAARADERRAEVPAVERIVAEELDRYNGALAARSVAPLVTALHDWAEQVRGAEVARAGGRAGDAHAVDALTRRIVAKLLHSPTVNLKAAAGTAKGEALAETLRELFDLPG